MLSRVRAAVALGTVVLLMPSAALPAAGGPGDARMAGEAQMAGDAAAVVARPIPPGFAFDGAVGEWAPAPLEPLTLVPKQPGARSGRVWVAQEAQGLLVAGRVDGETPRFARDADGMPGGDHIELWLAVAHPLPLPPVGWGHQFGPQELSAADDCANDEGFGDDPQAVAECRAWFAAQLRYRAKLSRQFARQWQIAPGVAVETWAAPALAEMRKEERLAVEGLPPPDRAEAALATAFASASGQPGYSFEIRVPWAALPPADSLKLSRLSLMLDVFSPGAAGKYGPFSTTSEQRRYGYIETLGTVRLDPPRRYRLAACGYPLESDDFWQEKRLPALFIPGVAEQVDALFTLENPVRGYQYQPENPSPEVVMQTLFSRTLADGVTLCGPPLAVRRRDETRISTDFAVRPDFRSARVAGGWLVANGPVTGLASRLGTGACGACPLISLDVLFIPENDGAPVAAYSDSWLVEDEDPETGLSNARVVLDDDLRSVRVWAAEPDAEREHATWTFSRFCYADAQRTFERCEERTGVDPPALPMPPDG